MSCKHTGKTPGENIDFWVPVWQENTAYPEGSLVAYLDYAPELINPLPDMTVEVDATEIIYLNNVFIDVDDDSIQLTATSSDPTTVKASLVENILTLDYKKIGIVAITVSATANGKTTADSFVVDVTAVNQGPQVNSPLPDISVDEGAADSVIDISNIFSDLEGDAITITVVSTNLSLVEASVTTEPFPSSVSIDDFESDITLYGGLLHGEINSNSSVFREVFGLATNTAHSYRLAVPQSDESLLWSDAGTFTTRASTEPPILGNISAGGVTPSTADIAGLLMDTGGETPTIKIAWGEADGGREDINNWSNIVDLGRRGSTQSHEHNAFGQFSTTAEGLSAGTTYYARSFALTKHHNDVGSYDVTAFSITDSSITSAVTASAATDTLFTNYQITANGINPTSYEAINLPPGLSLNAGTGVISGTPTAGGVYDVVLVAKSASDSAVGSIVITVTGTTEPIVVSSPPTTVEANAAKFHGELTNTGGEDCVVSVYWGTSDGGELFFAWQNQANLGTHGIGPVVRNASGLSPGQTYHYRFVASNSSGQTWSAPQSFTTSSSAAIPTLGTAFKVLNVNSTWASVLAELDLTGGAATTATVFWGTVDEEEVTGSWQNQKNLANVQPGVFSFELTDLTPQAKYYVRIRANNAVGSTWSSGTQEFTPIASSKTPAVLYIDTSDKGEVPSSWAHAFASQVGTALTLSYKENQNGIGTIIVAATANEKTVTETFTVTVNAIAGD